MNIYTKNWVDTIPTLPLIKKYDNSKKRTITYINIASGFDIETTSTFLNDDKFAYMYEWTFGINDIICYGRTWKDFINLCEQLQNKFNLSENKRLIVYIHNFSYEFQFMRKYIEWLDVFASGERKPIKALSIYGIEFRDSYILSGYSLSKTAENNPKSTVKKLVGDLDYKLVRHHNTVLTDKELEYCNNDVEIILDYIKYQIELYGDITKIPLTNTGRIRKFVENNCLHYSTNHRKEGNGGKIKRYRDLMKECILDVEQYTLLKQAFQGGFTHASIKHVGKTLKNVHSIDFTSSYPYVMLSEKFPMSKPKLENVSRETFLDMVKDNDKGLLVQIKFNNIHSVNTYETYLSESKCYNISNAIINNGRIFKADSLTTTITDIDYTIIDKCYTYDDFEILKCYSFYMQYLPKQIINSILELYEKKTTLKGVRGKETEYLLSKGMLNSVYGMCVTDIVRTEYTYSDEWNCEKPTLEKLNEQITKYNNSRKRFLYYPWGVWVTAYARYNLWNGILSVGDDYIYSDTDSIKFLNYDKHKQFIDDYNRGCERKLKSMCDFRKIDFARCKPKTVNGVEKLIGVFDYEGEYLIFKTLGAKRYMYVQDDTLHITISGLSKQNGAKYLLKKYKTFDNVFKNFNDELYIPPNETGKNTHTYIDGEMGGYITDYQGNTQYVNSLSGVHLSECDFTLSLSKQYAKFIDDFINGYVYTGVKYE